MKLKCGLFLVLILISSVFLILVPVKSVADQPVRVCIDPPVITNPDVLFNVSINIENVVGLAGAAWHLSWDPSLLQVVKMNEVMFHQVTPQSEWDNIWQIAHDVDNVAGTADYCYLFVSGPRALSGGYCPINGTYTMAVFTFQLVGTGNCSIQISDSKLCDYPDNPIPHEVAGGFVSNSIPPNPIQSGPIGDSQLLFLINPHRMKNESFTVGSTFSVNLDMQMIAPHRGIIGMEYVVEWNPNVLECVNATEIMFHEVTPVNESDNIFDGGIYITDGRVEGYTTFVNYSRASAGGYSPIFGNHTVTTLTFRVKGVGATLLHLERCWASDVSDSTILYSTLDGFFGNRRNGDLNGDGAVDVFDAIVFAKSYGTFLAVYPGYSTWNEEADLNGDGRIDIYDAIQFAALYRH